MSYRHSVILVPDKALVRQIKKSILKIADMAAILVVFMSPFIQISTSI